MPLRLVERNKRVLDAAGELGLVRDLPGLEALEVLEQHDGEALREIPRHGLERPRAGHALDDALETGQQRERRIEERLLP